MGKEAEDVGNLMAGIRNNCVILLHVGVYWGCVFGHGVDEEVIWV
jgi:hypothetical protein